MVEHGTENAGVDSSSLSLGTTFPISPHKLSPVRPIVIYKNKGNGQRPDALAV